MQVKTSWDLTKMSNYGRLNDSLSKVAECTAIHHFNVPLIKKLKLEWWSNPPGFDCSIHHVLFVIQLEVMDYSNMANRNDKPEPEINLHKLNWNWNGFFKINPTTDKTEKMTVISEFIGL